MILRVFYIACAAYVIGMLYLGSALVGEADAGRRIPVRCDAKTKLTPYPHLHGTRYRCAPGVKVGWIEWVPAWVLGR